VQNADTGPRLNLNGSAFRVGIVQARFNLHITEQLARTCVDELLSLGVVQENIRHITVPGALEVPVALSALSQTKKFDALVALGCVIRGETYHFELVSNQSAAGVSRVSLDDNLPVVNAILTVENEAQAVVRAKYIGVDAARTAVEMAHLMKDLL
jgi:6,7-dimethyl-8-ribityllumazine synthase